MQLPKTIDAAKAALGSIEGLVTARQWERAAIVWAFTYDGRGTPQSKEVYSVTGFADLRIAGLASKPTVIAYRAAWKRAMDEADAPDVKPGSKFDTPALDWGFPDEAGADRQMRYSRKEPESFAGALSRGDVNPVALADALDDQTAKTIARHVLRDPAVRRQLVRDDDVRAEWSRSAREEDARTAARVARQVREDAPRLIEAREFYEAQARIMHARQDVRQAVELLAGLPPLGDAERDELGRALELLTTGIDHLQAFTKARRSASLADEVQEFLAANQ